MTDAYLPLVQAPRGSRLIGVAAALQARMVASNPGYPVTVVPDFDFDGRAVVFYNGDKDAGNFFAGSFVVRRVDTVGAWRYYLCCPESGRANYLIGDNDGDPTVTRVMGQIYAPTGP